MAHKGIMLSLNHRVVFCECACYHVLEIHYFMKYLVISKTKELQLKFMMVNYSALRLIIP